MTTHSSILAGKIPWTEELMGYSPWGLKEPDMTEWLSMYAYDISNYQIKISAISEMRSMNNIHKVHTSRDSINSSGTNCKKQNGVIFYIASLLWNLFKDIFCGKTRNFLTPHILISPRTNWKCEKMKKLT